MKEIKKKAMIQCMTSEVQFCYVCLKCICICAFSQLEISIHAIGTNDQIEGGNKLCDFLQQSNQRKNCDNKIYCKIFLVPPLHISYMLTHALKILKVCYFFILMIFVLGFLCIDVIVSMY
jgi:hypothetical protein